MPKLSAGQLTFLRGATSRYHRTLAGSPAEEYLADRDLADAAGPFRLGYVAEPLPGHETYAGMLAIPYLRRSVSGWSVVSMRFRCIEDHEHRGHGKYMSLPGDPPRLFNTLALQSDSDVVGLEEGELDAISLTLCGVPAVGAPGAESWKPHWTLPFLGFEAVYALTDGDEAGRRFGHARAKELPNLKIVPSAPGEDVNSEMIRHGREYIRSKVLSGARQKENTS
jgi:hypothetical protein